MEIYTFARDMTLLGVIDNVESFIWTRRYWSCGEFKLLVPFTPAHAALLQKYNLIMKRGGREAAEIRYVHLGKDRQGQERIEAQGRFISCWLNKRIVLNQVVANDNTQNILYRLVRENATAPANTARKIPNLSIETSASLGSGVIQYANEDRAYLMDACEDAAKAAKLGFYIRTDPQAKQHYFRVYNGRDLTYGNTANNPPAIFSQEFNNILEQEFTNSIENVRSTAYVGGEVKEDVPQKVVEIGASASGLNRDEIFIPATDIKQEYKDESGNDVTLTNAQYLAALRARGSQELEHHTEALSFASKINTVSGLQYQRDYDLGDRVTCVDKRWGVKIDVRITEVTEIYERGKNGDIEITFGENLPVRIDKLMRAIK